MSAQWVNARILQNGRSKYRLSIDDPPAACDWTVVEEHSVCLDGSTDRAAVQAQLAQLCESPVSYNVAKNLLADLRGHVLGQTPVSIVERKYATFWLRLCARIADGLVFMPIVLIGTFLFGRSTVSWVRVVWFSIAQCAVLVYVIVMHGIYGQTLGKMSCHVTVRDISERPLSMKQAVLRDIVDIILLPLGLWVYLPQVIRHGSLEPSDPPFLSSLFTYICMGWVWLDGLTMLTNSKRRALHDFIAGSVVVRDK
jgi:uncharacterized RDD family membrane protein YckC